MAEKELRKLNRKELLELLLIQCEEMERMQLEYNEMKTNLETFMESYERLKGKLNVKDERLNQKDAKIAELTGIIEEMKNSAAAPPDAETIAEAAVKLNNIFEDARKSMDQYLKALNLAEDPKKQNPILFEAALKTKPPKRQSLINLGGRIPALKETLEQKDAMHG